MFPLNCDGCYTFRDILSDPVPNFECFGKKIPRCPCTECITKVTCTVKVRCLDFLFACVKYPTKDYKDITEVLETVVPDDLMRIIRNAQHLNNMEDNSYEVCKEDQWK